MLDMHPAIRHTALIGLSPQARTSTGSHVSDALSSRPVIPFEEARTREDLALAITRVEALNSAGKLEEGWRLLSDSGLGGALFRLQYAYEKLELMQPYFPQGWEQDSILSEADQSYVLSEVALALGDTGKHHSALMVHIKELKLDLANERMYETIKSLGNTSVSLEQLGQLSAGERLTSLALRLADAAKSEKDVVWLKTNQADFHICAGRLKEAEAILVSLRQAVGKKTTDPANEAHILETDLSLAFRQNRLSEQIASDCLSRIRLVGRRRDERDGLLTVAAWHQRNGRHEAALDAYGDLIALANEIGSPELLNYEAFRALSVAACGRGEEARRIAMKIDRGREPAHGPLALLYLELGDRTKARLHALAGYKQAWGEGPPYHDHWGMEDCRKVLAAIGESEPMLPAFNPSKVEPFDFEPEVERLIVKVLAEKAEHDAHAKLVDAMDQPELASKGASEPS
jgi:tetratricopeptide (TPR) repeat protein